MRTANTLLAKVIFDDRIRESHAARRRRMAREHRAELRKATRAAARRLRAERRSQSEPNIVVDLREAERTVAEKEYAEERSSVAS